MSTKRRTDQELAAYHAAMSAKYQQRMAVRQDARLSRMRRAATLLKRIALEGGDEKLAAACIDTADAIWLRLSVMAKAKATEPMLPFDSDPDFEVKE